MSVADKIIYVWLPLGFASLLFVWVVYKYGKKCLAWMLKKLYDLFISREDHIW